MNIRLVSSARTPKPTSLLAFDSFFFAPNSNKENTFFFCFGERFRQGVRADIRHSTLVRQMVYHVWDVVSARSQDRASSLVHTQKGKR